MNKIIENDFQMIENRYSTILSLIKGKKILVTGSTGMITTYLCLFFLSIAEKYELQLYFHCRNIKKAKDKWLLYKDEWLKTLDFLPSSHDKSKENIKFK